MKKLTAFFIIFFGAALGALFIFAIFNFNPVSYSDLQPTDTVATVDTVPGSSAPNVPVDPVVIEPTPTVPVEPPVVVPSGLTAIEVATHNTASDCYLIVKGKVYDVTNYIDQHPGGKQNIYNYCGKESSTTFANIHSNFAWNLLADYYVDDLAQ
ncbi:MAG: cytochrome b5 domain-containing protein [Candidatus Gracilibacteria bacterium]